MSEQHDIIVIGAGIIGLSIALKLLETGRAVTLIDRSGGEVGASAGNAGAFAFADIMPLATPGIMNRAPKWLLDPLGPLSIPPAYALKLVPWLLRFWRASWRDRYEAALSAQAQLMTFSAVALERQIKAVNGENLMQREGQLQLFESEHEFQQSLPVWKLRGDHGVAFDLLETPKAIADIQPGLNPRFSHAGFTPDWMNTCDPAEWAEHLARHFVMQGGGVQSGTIKAIAHGPDAVTLTTDDAKLSAKQVVVAAGAWSHHLARTLGDKIPLETERGYNTTLPAGAFDLRTHLTFGGHGFVVSKVAGGVRVGGAVELGGLNLPPNFKRSEILLKKAAQFLPELNVNNGKQWMGFRPSMPDSLPVIDRSPRAKNVLYAFGHGHLGLTQSAGTAELICALANGTKPPISHDALSAFSASRF